MQTASLTIDEFRDELGPALVSQIHDPANGLRAIVVVDNVARGPAIGGVRMATDVTTEEVFRLARAMTFKNAAAGLAHGGGKAGILADAKTADKERLMRAFGRAVRHLVQYIPGPDMGTDETCMGWLHDETGRVVGLPRILGGIPLDEIGATGYGVAQCAVVAAPWIELELRGARVAIEGFGNVGRHAARFLEELGARLVAASDTGGTIHCPDGIPVETLMEVKRRTGSVTGHERGDKLPKADLFRVPHDILVPAARPDCIHEGNVASIPAKLILQGANIPATAQAEAALHARGVLVIPDFIANAGGVICGAVEYHGGTEKIAFETISTTICANTKELLERSRADDVLPREAAMRFARERIEAARAYRQYAL